MKQDLYTNIKKQFIRNQPIEVYGEAIIHASRPSSTGDKEISVYQTRKMKFETGWSETGKMSIFRENSKNIAVIF